MAELMRKIYNYYAPAVLVLGLAASGHWIWLLGAIGFLLVTISNNLEAQMLVTAKGMDEIIRRLADRDGKDRSSVPSSTPASI